jgi:hypothetical protein
VGLARQWRGVAHLGRRAVTRFERSLSLSRPRIPLGRLQFSLRSLSFYIKSSSGALSVIVVENARTGGHHLPSLAGTARDLTVQLSN